MEPNSGSAIFQLYYLVTFLILMSVLARVTAFSGPSSPGSYLLSSIVLFLPLNSFSSFMFIFDHLKSYFMFKNWTNHANIRSDC